MSGCYSLSEVKGDAKAMTDYIAVLEARAVMEDVDLQEV